LAADPSGTAAVGGGARLFGVTLAPGYGVGNALTYLFAAFVTIGMLAFVSFIQPFLLNANLAIPEGEQGRALAILNTANEIVALLLVAPIGALSDRIGRRPVYALGFLWLAAGFFLYPLARTFPHACGGPRGHAARAVARAVHRHHRLLSGARRDARGAAARPPAAAARGERLGRRDGWTAHARHRGGALRPHRRGLLVGAAARGACRA
jgi:MFS family permease